MKLITLCRRNPGDGKLLGNEVLLSEIKFRKFKFNNRPRPENIKRILIITCFTEFGCETVGLMYCIPEIIAQNLGAYVICVGWYGREYLYRHLVDEFWEIDESAMHLREYMNAFANVSKNIKRIEKKLEKHGMVFRGSGMGELCITNRCYVCNKIWSGCQLEPCPYCNSQNIKYGYFSNVPYHRLSALQIPRPSIKKLEEAKLYLKKNPVGIFARARKMYGRNLPAQFYVKLISYLEKNGYSPIWLGEKQSTLPCPVDHIVDFSRMPESRDLELTLAIISNLKFTVQFWTASTRLASMMNVPWILFESPDQIVGVGQEGKRIGLTTDYNKKKLVLSHYCNVLEDHDQAINVLDRAIGEIKNNNWQEIIGMIENPETVELMLKKQEIWR